MAFKNGMRPVRPGEILREEFLIPLGMSANALATALRVPAPRINDVVRERRAVTADTALRLARFNASYAWVMHEKQCALKMPLPSDPHRRVQGAFDEQCRAIRPLQWQPR